MRRLGISEDSKKLANSRTCGSCFATNSTPASRMKEIDKQIQQYFGNDISRMSRLGITKYAVVTYVLRVQRGWTKESAIRALLLGRSLSSVDAQFVRSVLDSLPSATVKRSGT
jgi:hypothetical protein